MANNLVAVALTGPAFVDALQRAWDNGDAVLPIGTGLPDAAVAGLLAEIRPNVIIDESGRTPLDHGQPVEVGDALVVATSGSTGTPKGVVLTHDAVAASARATSAALHIGDDDHWLACLPLNHIGGLSVVTRALHSATGLTVLPRFDPGEVEDAARRGATRVSLVATALKRCDTSAFRTVLLGGSAIPADRPANAVATYGMTETGSGLVYDGYPIDTAEVRIVEGEVQVHGPMLLRSYRSGHDPKTEDGWLPTGDGGDLAEDGRLTVHGRRGDMIITGGENVWPEPVERILEQHGDLAAVAVIGRPDAEWGQVVTAVVELSGARIPELSELRDMVKAELPVHHAPKAIEVTDRIPRTASGKPQRHRL